MATISCEICGGKLTIQPGGKAALCDGCGMEYSIDRVRELLGVANTNPQVNTVSTPFANAPEQQIENFLKLAQQAISNKEWETAEKYCNKIQELNFGDYRAFRLRGNIELLTDGKMERAISNYRQAVENAPAGKKAEIINEFIEKAGKHTHKALEEIKKIRMLLDEQQFHELSRQLAKDVVTISIDFIDEQYSKYQQYEDYSKKPLNAGILIGNCSSYVKSAVNYISNAFPGEQMIPVANVVSDAYEKLWKSFVKFEKIECMEYNFYTSQYRAVNFFEMDDVTEYITKYKSAKDLLSQAKNKLFKEIRQRQKQEYWENHPQEKAEMEEEQKKLQQEIIELRTQADNPPQRAEIVKLYGEVMPINDALERLGFFQMKEKKQLQEKKREIEQRIEDLDREKRSYIKDIERKIAKKQEQCDAIKQKFYVS